MFAIGITKDVRSVLNPINDIGKTRQNQAEIEKQLSEFVVQHSLGKKLRILFNCLYI